MSERCGCAAWTHDSPSAARPRLDLHQDVAGPCVPCSDKPSSYMKSEAGFGSVQCCAMGAESSLMQRHDEQQQWCYVIGGSHCSGAHQSSFDAKLRWRPCGPGVSIGDFIGGGGGGELPHAAPADDATRADELSLCQKGHDRAWCMKQHPTSGAVKAAKEAAPKEAAPEPAAAAKGAAAAAKEVAMKGKAEAKAKPPQHVDVVAAGSEAKAALMSRTRWANEGPLLELRQAAEDFLSKGHREADYKRFASLLRTTVRPPPPPPVPPHHHRSVRLNDQPHRTWQALPEP